MINKIASQIESALRDILRDKLKRIIIFGSYAREEFDNESDIDIMILIKSSDVSQYEDYIDDIANDLTIEYEILVSIFLESEEQYYNDMEIQGLYRNVENEGLEVYAG